MANGRGEQELDNLFACWKTRGMLGQYHRGQHCSVASKKATFARGENSGVTKQNSEVTGVQELQNGIQAFRSVDGESCPLKAIGIFLKKKASEMLKGKIC